MNFLKPNSLYNDILFAFAPMVRENTPMKHKVLCIDDETHNLEALERLLRKQYEVETATSGPEALEKLKNNSFSLIISDQKMPEMTGVEFFMLAKQEQPEAIRVLLTGYTDLESVINAINQGQIYRYITKPWEPEEFLSVVKQAIEVHEMKGLIAKQNKELMKANDELKSLDKLKTDFMLLVNHELKTPLTAIFSFSQLLSEESLSPEQKLYVEKISKNTHRLQDLIKDTLLITKIQTDQKMNTKEEIELKRLLNEQWALIESEHKNKNITLEKDNDSPFPQKVNQKSLEIIFKKCLHNCFVHGKSNSTVKVSMSDSHDSWSLTFTNELIKDLEKSPEALLTAFSTDKEILNHSGGAGLGLAVIQAIVNLFSGSIDIKTQNKMFSIQITFPKS